MNKFIKLILALVIVIWSSVAISDEDQNVCYKAIDEYFDSNIKLKMAKFDKHYLKTIPLNFYLKINKEKMFKACPQKFATYASNVDMGDIFNSDKSKNKNPDGNQICMSGIFSVHLFLHYLETRNAPPTTEDKAELNEIFENFINSNNPNICCKLNKEFFLPMQEYFSPILEERISKV